MCYGSSGRFQSGVRTGLETDGYIYIYILQPRFLSVSYFLHISLNASPGVKHSRYDNNRDTKSYSIQNPAPSYPNT